MAEITKPLEAIDLADGQSIEFHVVRWEAGVFTIFPAHAPAGKTIDVIRVHVPPADKDHFPFYYDLTAASLVAQIRPQLARSDFPHLAFRITAHGFGAKKRFGLEINPSPALKGAP